ncbi:hypothetical protein ACH5RR_033567 [Cinchona calisaya]|uniref:Uncharacterized protein n=1 Tax=Cinchona calisaya TaxID=153742 RepID=A0ABD2YPW8_9GENT
MFFNRETPNFVHSLGRALDEWWEFRSNNQIIQDGSSEETDVLNHVRDANRISATEIYIEMEAAMDKSKKRYGYSIMARDKFGRLLKIWAEGREGNAESTLVEADAMRNSLMFAKDARWDKV